MEAKIIFAVVAILSCTVQAEVGTKCYDTSECAADECCQILSEFQIVSKRQADLVLQPSIDLKAGTCEKYQQLNDSCNVFDKPNGYCSCAPGLECKMYEVPLQQGTDVDAISGSSLRRMVPSKRKMAPPHPGYQWVSQCLEIQQK